MDVDLRTFSKTEGVGHQTLWFTRLDDGYTWLIATSLVLLLPLVWMIGAGHQGWPDWPWVAVSLLAISCPPVVVLLGAPRVGFVLRPKSLQVLWRTSLSVHSQVQIALDELDDVRVVQGQWGPQLRLTRSHGETLVVRVGSGPDNPQHLEQLAADIQERRAVYLATHTERSSEADRRALQDLSRQAQGQR